MPRTLLPEEHRSTHPCADDGSHRTLERQAQREQRRRTRDVDATLQHRVEATVHGRPPPVCPVGPGIAEASSAIGTLTNCSR